MSGERGRYGRAEGYRARARRHRGENRHRAATVRRLRAAGAGRGAIARLTGLSLWAVRDVLAGREPPGEKWQPREAEHGEGGGI